MVTIGQTVKAKVTEYVALYETFKKDKQLSSRALGLARHDLLIQEIVAKMALEEFDAEMKKRGAK